MSDSFDSITTSKTTDSEQPNDETMVSKTAHDENENITPVLPVSILNDIRLYKRLGLFSTAAFITTFIVVMVIVIQLYNLPNSVSRCNYESTPPAMIRPVLDQSGIDVTTQCRALNDRVKTQLSLAAKKIHVFACDSASARQLSPRKVSGVGMVMATGSRKFRTNSSVTLWIDTDGDQNADRQVVLEDGLDQPHGVEWMDDNNLYIATARTLYRYEGLYSFLRGETDMFGKREITQLPYLASMQWHHIRMQKNGRLLVSNSAGCDHCLPEHPDAASIIRFDHCFDTHESYVRGVRFSVGMATRDDRLFFTNNAHDSIDGDDPWDSIGVATRAGQHFGFPYCHVTNTTNALDSTTNSEVSSRAYYANSVTGHDCSEFDSGVPIGKHIAPLGIAFADDNTILIAERGAYGHTPPVGYRVSSIGTDLKNYKPFISGFLNESSQVSWGRPVDVATMEGTIYVSDDKANAIYAVCP
jgi:glucose/arabinose dehydrogenase